ncbi:hypothetical protein P3R38_13250 [Pseudomonas sp. NyZ480]|uniref:hypothetical protein n=1 Tax=Pseudomonas sp. NyZ480 TaxID=3035289 RepID=UPI002409D364|nr:hypothetical protein [Pseudomonas sp. NyZ480]WEZ86486.1 hypothetical protein P3R38_13250 [Pseudomonas sp. NyZ480]
MAKVDFNSAVSVARENVKTLVPSAENLTLEEALISQDGKMYEVTFSYDLDRDNPLRFGIAPDNISRLASLMGRRREYKVFLVDAHTGEFRGFRKYKEQ